MQVLSATRFRGSPYDIDLLDAPYNVHVVGTLVQIIFVEYIRLTSSANFLIIPVRAEVFQDVLPY